MANNFIILSIAGRSSATQKIKLCICIRQTAPRGFAAVGAVQFICDHQCGFKDQIPLLRFVVSSVNASSKLGDEAPKCVAWGPWDGVFSTPQGRGLGGAKFFFCGLEMAYFGEF